MTGEDAASAPQLRAFHDQNFRTYGFHVGEHCGPKVNGTSHAVDHGMATGPTRDYQAMRPTKTPYALWQAGKALPRRLRLIRSHEFTLAGCSATVAVEVLWILPERDRRGFGISILRMRNPMG